MSYMVIELTCSGIPEEELKAEHFTDFQEGVLQQLDAPIQASIRRGVPYKIVDIESKEAICEFNLKNVKASDFDIRMLARTLYEGAQKFYEDPENVKAFEKWKREQDKKNGKAPRK